MKPRTKKIFIITASAVCVLAVFTTALLLMNAKVETEATVKLPVYYYNPAASRLEAEIRSVPKGSTDVLLEAAIGLLSETPRTPTLMKTMPEDNDLLAGYTLDGNTLYVTYSSRYYDLTPLEEAFFRASMIWTVTEVPAVEQVFFTVEGGELLNSRGNPLGFGTRETVDINPGISWERITTRTFTLYFVNEETDGLLPEARTADSVNLDQIEKYIVQQLIDGPLEEGHVSGIPIETKIFEIKTEDSICYVNLSSDFVNKFTGSPAMAKLTLYAIVNSLVENVSHVKRVQFLIESNLEDQFKGVTEFNRLFERDDTLIIKDDTGSGA